MLLCIFELDELYLLMWVLLENMPSQVVIVAYPTYMHVVIRTWYFLPVYTLLNARYIAEWRFILTTEKQTSSESYDLDLWPPMLIVSSHCPLSIVHLYQFAANLIHLALPHVDVLCLILQGSLLTWNSVYNFGFMQQTTTGIKLVKSQIATW